MRRLLPLFSMLLLLFSTLSYGQPWSNILSSSRAINWSNAGLPATLPDGETTPNPWTPPTRTQCVTSACKTLSGGTVTFASINAALASASSGQYVLVPSGTFALNGTTPDCSNGSSNILMYSTNGVTLRGSGPQSTTIKLTGAAQFCFSVSWNSGTQAVTSGATQGSTSITVASISAGGGLTAGQLINFNQCNTGLSGSSCGGTQTDNGGIFVCQASSSCSQQTTLASNSVQQQTVLVTSITGGGPYTVNFTPALRLPNWSGGQNPTIYWNNSNNGAGVASPNGLGLEDMTINLNGNTANVPIFANYTYASWVKGIRSLGIGTSFPVQSNNAKNFLFINNYVYAALGTGDGDNIALASGGTSDSLSINNILTGGDAWEGQGSSSGNVIAYNFSRFANTSYYNDAMFEHQGGSSYQLYEGNEVAKINDDDTWGTHSLETSFRNYLNGADLPYVIADGAGTAFSIGIGAFSRFNNAVGNALGSSIITSYQSTIASPESSPIFEFNRGGPQDSLTETGYLRWGNCDTVTNTCRFQSSEVPTSLSGNAVPFENTVPSNNNLPCSFFLAGYTSTTCTPHPSGGTGLNFWKVCTNWTTFPTACAATQTNPFPATGPDVTGGAYVNGTSYDVPAGIAYNNLPTDSGYQNSYTVSSSSYSSGTETLTVSGLPNSTHIIGGFQLTGAAGACAPTSGVSYTSRSDGEILMTGSTSTTVSYALASNPGASCAGTMKFPDVRQFDERVYENDSSSDPPPPAPTGLTAVVH